MPGGRGAGGDRGPFRGHVAPDALASSTVLWGHPGGLVAIRASRLVHVSRATRTIERDGDASGCGRRLPGLRRPRTTAASSAPLRPLRRAAEVVGLAEAGAALLNLRACPVGASTGIRSVAGPWVTADPPGRDGRVVRPPDGTAVLALTCQLDVDGHRLWDGSCGQGRVPARTRITNSRVRPQRPGPIACRASTTFRWRPSLRGRVTSTALSSNP